jgi:hypothetical protein
MSGLGGESELHNKATVCVGECGWIRVGVCVGDIFPFSRRPTDGETFSHLFQVDIEAKLKPFSLALSLPLP